VVEKIKCIHCGADATVLETPVMLNKRIEYFEGGMTWRMTPFVYEPEGNEVDVFYVCDEHSGKTHIADIVNRLSYVDRGETIKKVIDSLVMSLPPPSKG
jgi:hypothetical protein